MTYGIGTGFQATEEDVLSAASEIGIEMTIDQADVYLKGLSRADLSEIERRAMDADDLDEQTAFAVAQIGEFLRRDGHAPLAASL